ncbi:MAG TPA: hypothetical protein PLM49_04585 [Bacteroidales bacterium]|nr:hypothetical protein [Bacteroidales bacterium]
MMKPVLWYVLVFVVVSLFSCKQPQSQKSSNEEQQSVEHTKVVAHYSDVPQAKEKSFDEVLKTKAKSLTKESIDVMEAYATKYVLAAHNPVSRGLLSNYFWYVYNALPEFVDESERHSGYYKDENQQPEKERMIAYAIYKIDRSPDNLKSLYETYKPRLTELVSKQLYEDLLIDEEVNSRIYVYERLTEIDNYSELLTLAYNHADTASGILYFDGEETYFEVCNPAYGFDSNRLSELICQYLNIDRYDSYYCDDAWSFWMRRNKEGNMQTVYEILKDIQSIYK